MDVASFKRLEMKAPITANAGGFHVQSFTCRLLTLSAPLLIFTASETSLVCLVARWMKDSINNHRFLFPYNKLVTFLEQKKKKGKHTYSSFQQIIVFFLFFFFIVLIMYDQKIQTTSRVCAQKDYLHQAGIGVKYSGIIGAGKKKKKVFYVNLCMHPVLTAVLFHPVNETYSEFTHSISPLKAGQ